MRSRSVQYTPYTCTRLGLWVTNSILYLRSLKTFVIYGITATILILLLLLIIIKERKVIKTSNLVETCFLGGRMVSGYITTLRVTVRHGHCDRLRINKTISKMCSTCFSLKYVLCGVRQQFDVSVRVQVSPLSMLQGRLCGLCGNNNYDSSDDMTTLDKQLLSSSRLFVMDNLLPSSSCDASDYETQLGLRHEGSQLPVHVQ